MSNNNNNNSNNNIKKVGGKTAKPKDLGTEVVETTTATTTAKTAIRPKEIISRDSIIENAIPIGPGLGMDDSYFPYHLKRVKGLDQQQTPTTFRTGPDGVIWLFPNKGGGAEWYSYGVVEPNDFHKIIKNEQVVYKNGKLGLYNEFAVYPSGRGQGQGNTLVYDYKYKPTPDFLYNEKGIRNHEMTVYLKVGSSNNNNKTTNNTNTNSQKNRDNDYRSVRFRMRGRDEDDRRSSIEVWYPTGYHTDVLMNFNYSITEENKEFIRSVRQFTNTYAGIIQENKWIGLKYVDVVAEDKSHMWIGLYVDYEPFLHVDDNTTSIDVDYQTPPSLKPRNTFELLADAIITTGTTKKPLPTWKGHKDCIIVEGYENVEFYNISDREIDSTGIKPFHTSHLTVNEHASSYRPSLIPTKINPVDWEKKSTWERFNT